MKQPCVYIVASKRHGTLYTGVTANLPKRAYVHREGLMKGFSKKYGCKMLVWYEVHESMIEAIAREKQIKAGSRTKKPSQEACVDRSAKPRMDRPLRVIDMILPEPIHVIARSEATKQSIDTEYAERWIASLRSQ
jgi:predicted GIY-YIG superfamily endonuclease